MKITIAAAGKIREKFIRDGIDEYSKRITRYASFSISEAADSGVSDPLKAQKTEAAALAPHLKGYVFALASEGKNLTSEELADGMKKLAANGVGEFCFVIGGSHGLSEDIKKSSGFLLSFGRQTFPHQLMRLVLTEQIYRALTIINGHPYNK